MNARTTSFIFLSALLFAVVAVNGSTTTLPYVIKPTLPMIYLNWTIINLDPTLTPDYINATLKQYNISVKHVMNASGNIQFEMLMDNGEARWVPFGNENFTCTIINENDKALIGKTGKSLGGNYLDRSNVIHRAKDTQVDLAIRILHEIDHGEDLDADGMFTTERKGFEQWMQDRDYPFKDFYWNRVKYESIFMNYKQGEGQQVYLDFHMWLFNQSCNKAK